MKICGLGLKRRFGVDVVETLTLIPPGMHSPVGEDDRNLAYTLAELKDAFPFIPETTSHEELRSEDILPEMRKMFYRDGRWQEFQAGVPHTVHWECIEQTEDGVDLNLQLRDTYYVPCTGDVELIVICGDDQWNELAVGGTPFIDGMSELPVPKEIFDRAPLHLYFFLEGDEIPVAHIKLTQEELGHGLECGAAVGSDR